MKIFTSLAFVALLTLSVGAQQKKLPPIPMEGAPDLEILGTFLQGSDDAGRPVFSIDVRNAGKQIIKAVRWEYYLSVPSGTDSVDIRVTAVTEGLALKPTAQRRLQIAVGNNILDSTLSTMRPSRIRIIRVDYDSATPWHRAAE